MPNSPSFSPVLKQLTYIHEENLSRSEFGGSEFGGYPSLMQRNDAYDIRESMSVHCGYDNCSHDILSKLWNIILFLIRVFLGKNSYLFCFVFCFMSYTGNNSGFSLSVLSFVVIFLLTNAYPRQTDLSKELSLDVRQDTISMTLTFLKWISVMGWLLPQQSLVLLFISPLKNSFLCLSQLVIF